MAEKVHELDLGTQLAKRDIRVYTVSYPFIPMTVCCLKCFGKTSSTLMQHSNLASVQLRRFFSIIADALEWIAKHLGVEFLWHYLDDFIIVGHPESDECGFHLHFRRCVNALAYLLLGKRLNAQALAYHFWAL